MKKLRLDMDALSVVSFPTAPAPQVRGTVDGNVLTPKCVVTSGVDSCWCSEYNTCNCTI